MWKALSLADRVGQVFLLPITTKFYPTVEGKIYRETRNTMSDEVKVETLTEQVTASTATPAQQRPEEVEQALRDEIATLKREAASAARASEDALSEQRLRTARSIAHSKPAEKVGNGMADVELHKAIAAVGGPCFWPRLSPAEQEAALGIQGGAQTKNSDIAKIFGPHSDSAAANRLALSNPAEYKRLRLLAKLRKLY
jgi:hypothetical protein